MDQIQTETIAFASRRSGHLRVGLLLLIAIIGLFIVKWNPYFHKLFASGADHAFGIPVIYGKELIPPPPSLASEVDYSIIYFKAIWQAMLLGLLLAATIDALVPGDWLGRVLGGSRFRS